MPSTRWKHKIRNGSRLSYEVTGTTLFILGHWDRVVFTGGRHLYTRSMGVSGLGVISRQAFCFRGWWVDSAGLQGDDCNKNVFVYMSLLFHCFREQ